MKKILFLLVAAFVCSTINAQVVTSTSFRREKSKAVWYIKGGMNIANFTGDGMDDAKGIIGYNVGIAFDRPIAGSGVFWGMGLQLATKGFKLEEQKYEQKFNSNKLEIPLNFGYKYSVNDDIAIDARIGGFVNYDVFGNFTQKYDGEEESYDLGDMEDYDRLGAGIQFGLGVWYQSLNFNITYQKGMIDQSDAKENNWMISVGYAF